MNYGVSSLSIYNSKMCIYAQSNLAMGECVSQSGVLGGFITTGVLFTVALKSRGEFLKGTGVSGVLGRGKISIECNVSACHLTVFSYLETVV